MNRIKTTLTLLAAAVALTACATRSFTPFVKEDGEISASKAYVHGRFEVEDVSDASVSLNSYDSIGLKFYCDEGKSFTVGLHPRQTEQIVEAPVGTCSLYEVIFTLGAKSANANPAPRRFTGKVLQKVNFQPGTLNYIGDVKGKVTFSSNGIVNTTRWNITEFKDRFTETSNAVINRYPAAASLKLINQLEQAR